MNTSLPKTKNRSFERKALLILSVAFVCVLLGGWIHALKLRQEVSANNAVINVDPTALIEVERMRNLADSQISNSRSFFLMGSTSLFEKQKQDKQNLLDSLASFEKSHSLPQVPELVKKITVLEEQQQDFFDQGMDFRKKQTESKIVGQFYNSKTAPIRTQINEHLNEIVTIHNAELERARSEAKAAAASAEVQIPLGMAWLTGTLAILFAAMAYLILRMLTERSRQITERDRLYDEAKKAVLARDEMISAISQDLKEPLQSINEVASVLTSTTDPVQTAELVDIIKSTVFDIEGLVKDICDQKNADLSSLTLRLDQLGIDEILDDARLMLQPIAKQRDVRLQFESANPPVLAFFDRERVMRVLANLVGNAVKFSPKHSKVIVKVRSDQSFVNISVADAGPGIPEKQLTNIFDNFWQARKTATQGAGVGLAIVKTIIEAHGGTVRVESQVGNGTTFTFSLPRRRPVGAQLKKPAPIRYTTKPRIKAEIEDGPVI